MESQFEQVLQSVGNEPGAVGAVVADSHGLCVGNTGQTKSSQSGFIKALAADAIELTGDKNVTVSVETAQRSIVIRNIDNGACFGVFKSA
eukprot:CAMPEP_0201515024 /NCGR_PEP_ID=MMETSP0161_2-20130828/6700_1 /ASSEMBLY_ACC=CAM_ASM_000251 /TAXON_ID=180227 /ORGANISM="Neoparamoeba aestuarina, Strain SoJaBio B1-5/56/2" /LENGTH=89 /DNA_ID=CAMNT_0047911727 /DNA_START=52 /DNA_END=321 /DNA_ORIENTATION=+